jgi:hypothetical protein
MLSSFARWLVAASILFLCLSWSSLATAQSPAEAQKHLVQGERLGREGKWKEALAEFEQAHEASPSAASASRIANAQYELGELVPAHAAYESLLAEYGKSLFGADKRKAEERLKELAGKTGTLTIRVSEKDATVRLGEEAIGTSPLASPIRVKSGDHTIKVTKSGFRPYQAPIAVAPGASVVADVLLEAVATMGQIEVREKTGQPIHVFIDGSDVGPAPYAGPLEPGPHDVGGKSDTLEAPTQSVTVEGGETAVVELEAGPLMGRLEVQVADDRGKIFVDGVEKGEGSFAGDVPAGEHKLEVTHPGYEPFEKTVTVVAGDVLVETVALRRIGGSEITPTEEEGGAAWTFDGLYGGVFLAGYAIPTGSGNSLEDSCPSLGATSCESSLPIGGGLSGYVGYAFAPLGFELFLTGQADVAQPSASFDGQTGSDINPLIAAPAREEEFTIGRFGGGAAVRARVLLPIGRFRVTGAGGVGFAYKEAILGRDTTAADGSTGSTSEDSQGYVSPALSFEIAGQMLLAGSTQVMLGLTAWIETAGDDLRTEPRGDVFLLKDGDDDFVPHPHATPAYDMSTGTQFFLGPFLGVQFGP